MSSGPKLWALTRAWGAGPGEKDGGTLTARSWELVIGTALSAEEGTGLFNAGTLCD